MHISDSHAEASLAEPDSLANRAYWIAKGVGWENLPRRILQAVRVHSHWLRWRLDPTRFSDDRFTRQTNCPMAAQQELWRQRAERFLPIPSAACLRELAEDALWSREVEAVAKKAFAGQYPYFSHWIGQLGWPPDFNRNPLNDQAAPTGQHWLRTPRSCAAIGDIKLFWEPSRFTLAYALARAYARSGQDRWAEAFWTLLDAWIDQNPPMLTLAWGCGQECSFRLMAMLTAAITTLNSSAATPARLWRLSRLAWQTGLRVERNINYALSQGNNHGIGEAMGLFTVGAFFPEFEAADRWRRRGMRHLRAEVLRQIADDGSYVMHSVNYHRVMMDDLLWAIVIGRRSGHPLPQEVVDCFRRTAGWLEQLVDPASGRAPNYGSNDGANVLPFSVCDYTDFRPVSQAARYLLDHKRAFPPGPWDEKMVWLFGQESLAAEVSAPVRKPAWQADTGGYFILRGRRSWAMTRCHSYRFRPSQPDMLHVDLWMDGLNVLRDGGSYSYYCPGPWGSYFRSTAAHNTVEIDAQSQMIAGPRFLWFRWTRSRLIRFESSPDERWGLFEGEHFSYRRLPGGVVHRRALVRAGETYLVVDDLLGTGRHQAACRWRLCQADWRSLGDGRWAAEFPTGHVCITTAGNLPSRLLPPQPDIVPQAPDASAWESLYYGQKAAMPNLLAYAEAELPLRQVTAVGTSPDMRMDFTPDRVRVLSSGQVLLAAELYPLGAGEGIVRTLDATGEGVA